MHTLFSYFFLKSTVANKGPLYGSLANLANMQNKKFELVNQFVTSQHNLAFTFFTS